ncbi:hypothetical protein K0M31_017743 [Melipona bicolor]|uniref:Uncharacterized protein n=1 Tax=Melipona bicolor TaxID=60889 RepID=A0AA40KSR1_9HYME|nr:hypothetical protein K0M31_017743 [Melipona bicolor]
MHHSVNEIVFTPQFLSGYCYGEYLRLHCFPDDACAQLDVIMARLVDTKEERKEKGQKNKKRFVVLPAAPDNGTTSHAHVPEKEQRQGYTAHYGTDYQLHHAVLQICDSLAANEQDSEKCERDQRGLGKYHGGESIDFLLESDLEENNGNRCDYYIRRWFMQQDDSSSSQRNYRHNITIRSLPSASNFIIFNGQKSPTNKILFGLIGFIIYAIVSTTFIE